MRLGKRVFYLLIIGLFSCSGNQIEQIKRQSFAQIITEEKDVVVKTTLGSVAGYLENGTYIYKGIPYAEAERFMPPQKPEKWKGNKSTRAYGPTCPQAKRTGWYNDEQAFVFDWDDGFTDEDCLRLNIWTQGINDHKKRPVMVWLHGGGYAAGSSQELPAYDGAALSKKGDIVIVSINHRLNVLGFLDLSAFGVRYEYSGNVGLLDIIAALQWINENIANFGGDPANVTIFGQSGGGGKVASLMASPKAKGLFHKAIVQSGSLLTTMETKYSRMIGCQLMKELQLQPTQIDELQKYPYEKLLEAGNKAIQVVRKQANDEGFYPFIFGWAPTVDGDILPNQPGCVKAFEISNDIPLLVGTTLHEFTSSTYNPSFRNIDKATAINEIKKKYGDKTDEFIAAFEKAYPSYVPKDLLDIDLIFRPAAVKHAILKSNQLNAKVYSYLFAWESPVLNGIFRSTHCMELPFVFNNIQRCSQMTGSGKDALELADLVSSAWIQFAYTGNPNTKELPLWAPFNTDNRATMIFNKICEMKFNHDKELLEVANSFPFNGF